MSGARPKSRRGLAAGAFWQWRFALLLLLFPGTTAAIPAAAQTSEGGAPSSSGAGPEAGPAGTGGGAVTTPALPGAVPDTLPPPPIGGFGFPSPAAPPYSVNNQIPTLTSPPTLRLQPYAGVVPLQAYDPTAPAVLIRPSLSLGETFTDNVNYVHSPRTFAAITQLGGGRIGLGGHPEAASRRDWSGQRILLSAELELRTLEPALSATSMRTAMAQFIPTCCMSMPRVR